MNRQNRATLSVLIAVFTLAVMLSSCGGGGGGGSAADTTPPGISSTVPANNAIDVSVHSAIVALFDEPIDPTTINGATFLVTGSSGTIAGTVVCSSATATFTPSSSLASGTTYTATITTGVTDAAGNAVAAAYSWKFTTAGGRQKAWGTPVLLEPSANPAYTPAVAADPDTNGKGDGTVTVVWEQSDGNQDSIYASRFTGTWSTPVTVETQSTGGFSGGASAPRVAMNQYGQAVVAWVYSEGPGNFRIWSNRFDNNAWQTEENISALTGNANSPQVAFDGSGDALYAVWSQYLYGSTQYNYRVVQRPYYYGRCPDGSVGPACVGDPSTIGWQSMTMIDSHDVGDASEPQIAAWGSRNAVAVWTQNTPAGNQIWANIVTNGTWSVPVRVNPGSTNGVAAPVVAADGSGNAVAVWMEWAPGRKTLYASRYALGNWSTPMQIDATADDNAGGFDPPRQQVVMDASGNVVILWQQQHGSPAEYSIYARRCPAGPLSGCSAPVRIEQSAGYADFPVLALAPNGDAIAAWKQDDGAARRIYASLFSAAGGTWSAAPSMAGGADSTWNEGPQIAIDGFGNATVVWTEYESGQYNIHANRYE